MSSRTWKNVQMEPYEIAFLWITVVKHQQFHMVQPNVYLKFSFLFFFFFVFSFFIVCFSFTFSFFIPFYSTTSLFAFPVQRYSICFLSENNKTSVGVPTMAQQVKNPTAAARVSVEVQVWSPAWHSGLKDSCMSWLQLRFNPWPAKTSICSRCGYKNKGLWIRLISYWRIMEEEVKKRV